MIVMQSGRFIPFPSIESAESFIKHYPEYKPCVIKNENGKIVRRLPTEPPPIQLTIWDDQQQKKE